MPDPEPGMVKSVFNYFATLPELTRVSGLVTGLLTIAGVTTESLATAARSATWPLSALVGMLAAGILLPASLQALSHDEERRGRGAWKFVAVAVPCGLSLLAGFTVWAANTPSTPTVSVSAGPDADSISVTASSTNIGSLEVMEVLITETPCEEWASSYPRQDRWLLHAKVGGDSDGQAMVNHVVEVAEDRPRVLCVMAKVQRWWDSVASLQVGSDPCAASHKTDTATTPSSTGTDNAPASPPTATTINGAATPSCTSTAPTDDDSTSRSPEPTADNSAESPSATVTDDTSPTPCTPTPEC